MSEKKFWVSGTGIYHRTLACVKARADHGNIDKVGPDEVQDLDRCKVCVYPDGIENNASIYEEIEGDRDLKAEDVDGVFDEIHRVSNPMNTGRKGHLYADCRKIREDDNVRTVGIITDPKREICELCHVRAIAANVLE